MYFTATLRGHSPGTPLKYLSQVLYKAPPKKELTMEEKIYADSGHGEWNEEAKSRKAQEKEELPQG